jgi:hypothetical protein
MKRLDFIKSLGIVVGSGMIPNSKPEKLYLAKHTSNADMTFGVNGVERMRITSSDNILLGTNTPDAGYRLVIS